MINFVYITTNQINGKQYVGDHSTNDLEKDNYVGSGIYILHALNEYGKENFKREILEHFNTKEEAFNAQEKYIQEYNTLVPNGYNISPKGGLCIKGCHSEETKQKIGKSNKGKVRSVYSKNIMSKRAKNRKIPAHYNHITQKEKQTIIYLHLLFKRGIHEISKTLNISHNTIKSFLIKNNIYLGRIYSEETKNKLSRNRKGKIRQHPQDSNKDRNAIRFAP
jgi:predicted DNA-binding transcriptional regulator